ncbi:RNA methyltransferase [Chryseolinea sp. T2]|uniref:TrmH family RNA methyltransferase n=1 Tax=Chryseolinea sp. T2 TaxID=3129255 RepID=UPI003077EACF
MEFLLFGAKLRNLGTDYIQPGIRSMHPLITSHQNPKIKHVLSLEKPRERSRERQFVFEGVREVSLAHRYGYKIVSLFFCPDIISREEATALVQDDRLLLPVEHSVFSKIAYREGTEGVVAVAEQKVHTLDKLKLSATPLVLILEGVEKPGNLGAMLRTADAAHIDAVIVCDSKTDLYNPNVVRSSVGCIFTTQTAVATPDEVMQWLKTERINAFVTDLQGAVPYHTVDFTSRAAIVMGTESTGISEGWREFSTSRIIIPMRGAIDSLNVSNAAAIVVFEAARQRGFS